MKPEAPAKETGGEAASHEEPVHHGYDKHEVWWEKKIVKWKDYGGTTLAGESKQLLGNKFGHI